MKTQVIPAQITTVEDRIAGNLNLTQLLLLMFPVLFGAIVYIVLLPAFAFSWYKIPLILLSVIVCVTLAIRVRGKLVLSWLTVILAYNLRAKYYVFDKNDSFLRKMQLPMFEKKKHALFKKATKDEKQKVLPSLSVSDLLKLEDLVNNPKYNFTLKNSAKGGFYVAFEQEQK